MRINFLRHNIDHAILRGAWLKPGTHVDLAGAFKPEMRETDGDVIARARVYVDTREGRKPRPATSSRRPRKASSHGEYRGRSLRLCRGKTGGRRNSEEITLFKSAARRLKTLRCDAGLFQGAREYPLFPVGSEGMFAQPSVSE